jgi:transposase
MQRGLKSSVMARKKKQIETEQTPEAKQLAKLQAEVAWLRAENDFLKKLEALTREEEALKKQKKARKPSGN